jgi:hypothetical protein
MITSIPPLEVDQAVVGTDPLGQARQRYLHP